MAYSIDELRIIFGLPSRHAVSKLAKTLNLVPTDRGEFSQAQLALMYALHSHLEAGKPLAEFPNLPIVPKDAPLPREPEVVGELVREVATEVVSAKIVPTSPPLNNSANNPPNQESPLGELLKAIASATTPKQDLLHNYHALENAVKHKWIISSSNVKELTGASPTGEVFIWANFEFTKAGKVGRGSGWKVCNLKA